MKPCFESSTSTTHQVSSKSSQHRKPKAIHTQSKATISCKKLFPLPIHNRSLSILSWTKLSAKLNIRTHCSLRVFKNYEITNALTDCFSEPDLLNQKDENIFLVCAAGKSNIDARLTTTVNRGSAHPKFTNSLDSSPQSYKWTGNQRPVSNILNHMVNQASTKTAYQTDQCRILDEIRTLQRNVSSRTLTPRRR